MQRIWRFLAPLVALFLLFVLVRTSIAGYAVELLPPHTTSRPAAKIDVLLRARVEAALSQRKVQKVDDAIDLALGITDSVLAFGLDHPTSLSFSAIERRGNCVEYAHLFAQIFNTAAQKAGLRATAYVVHSGDARLFGTPLPMRGFQDHDWVLIDDRSGAASGSPDGEIRRLFVDPTLHDAGLGWNISPSVKGVVNLPTASR